ncbi:XdhC family protein [Clostridia bacterium]|nr:XdhC family protein [Clostridia bacterium]
MDFQIIKEIVNNKGREMALATIIQATGSTPRHEGTNMLVFSDGSFVGTVGGGTGEERIRQFALSVIKDKKNAISQITLQDDIAMKEGMICGGTMKTHVEYVRETKTYERILSLLNNKEQGILFRDLEGDKKILVSEKEAKNQSELARELLPDELLTRLLHRDKFCVKGRWVIEAVTPYEKMVVFGGGHISIPLTEMASRCEFEVTVIDDRPEFANKERFPWADLVLCKPFEKALSEIGFDTATYVVLVTRGHAYDMICLREILKNPCKYIGMIGSKSRVKTLLNNLEEEGYDRELLDSIYTPIGLPIGAETTQEIAISIMSEIIALRRDRIAHFS